MSLDLTASTAARASTPMSQSILDLVRVLRHPADILEQAAAPGLFAEYEGGDWEAAHEEVRAILDARGATPEVAFRVLLAAARFLSIHRLRLHGNPWLHMQRFRGVAGISYVLHLDLDREDAITWNDRFYEALASGDLLNEAFCLNLRKRGPIR